MIKRGRGRPPKDQLDIELIQAVRAAQQQGFTAEAAFGEIARRWSPRARVDRGFAADVERCEEQVKKRYHRVKREYVTWEPSDPLLRVMAKALGLAPRMTRKKNSAAILLTGRPHKKGKN